MMKDQDQTGGTIGSSVTPVSAALRSQSAMVAGTGRSDDDTLQQSPVSTSAPRSAPSHKGEFPPSSGASEVGSGGPPNMNHARPHRLRHASSSVSTEDKSYDPYADPYPTNTSERTVAQYPSQTSLASGADDYETDDGYGMSECPDCGRKFNSTAYPKHVKICKDVFIKKRKAFDMAQKRVEGNPELLQILKKKEKEEKMKALKAAKAGNAAASNREETPVGGTQQQKWKQQSEAFRQALREARKAQQAQAEGRPLPPAMPSAPDPSLVPCPHCSRRFSEAAAERHIPQCRNIKAKPSSLKRGAGGGGGVNGTTRATALASVAAALPMAALPPKPLSKQRQNRRRP